MKCLTVWQLWAWLIVMGIKAVENRTWPTSYRGPLLIHAGKTFDHDGAEWVREQIKIGRIPPIAFPPDYDRGAIVGAVILRRCETLWKARMRGAVLSPWFAGPVGWHLSNPIALPEPIPLRGRQKIFNVSEEDAPGAVEMWRKLDRIYRTGRAMP